MIWWIVFHCHIDPRDWTVNKCQEPNPSLQLPEPGTPCRVPCWWRWCWPPWSSCHPDTSRWMVESPSAHTQRPIGTHATKPGHHMHAPHQICTVCIRLPREEFGFLHPVNHDIYIRAESANHRVLVVQVTLKIWRQQRWYSPAWGCRQPLEVEHAAGQRAQFPGCHNPQRTPDICTQNRTRKICCKRKKKLLKKKKKKKGQIQWAEKITGQLWDTLSWKL